MTTNKAYRKSRKHLIKKDKKRKSRSRRYKINKTNKTNISDLYTYESPVTNKSNSNYNVQNNVNVVHGLKDFLAIKK